MNFNYFLPVNIVFGCGRVSETGQLTKPYGTRALIVTGRSSAKKSGLYDRVKDSLYAAGIDSVLFDKVQQNPGNRGRTVRQSFPMRLRGRHWRRQHHGLRQGNRLSGSE